MTNAAMKVVTYTVDAPGGTNWNAADNGTYTVGIVGNVTDTSTPALPVAANAAAAMFTVNTADIPIAVLTQPATITATGGNSEAIVVTYSDPGASLVTPVLIEGSTIGTSNISVVSPNATPVTITAANPTAPANGSPIVVTYTASLPAGQTWSSSNDGTYTIKLSGTVPGAVTNTLGTPVAANADFGAFSVNLSDTVHPTASTNPPPLLQSVGDTHQIVVNYSDNAGILTSSVTSVGTSAITVKDNATGETLDVTAESISADTATNPKVLQVTYTLEQPDGNAFTSADNGSYTIALVGSPPITDTSGNAVLPDANLGTFVIAIGDTSHPNGTVTANEVTSNGATGETITFVLTSGQNDVSGGTTGEYIDVSTINLDSISVLSPSGAALTPKSLSLSTAVNAPTVTAIYVVAPPNGQAFRGVDNGAYDVTLNGVTDVAGLPLLPTTFTGSLTVDASGNPATALMNGTETFIEFGQSASLVQAGLEALVGGDGVTLASQTVFVNTLNGAVDILGQCQRERRCQHHLFGQCAGAANANL